MQSSSVLKIVVLGNTGVGKSALITRFTKNTFSEDTIVTAGGIY